MTSPLARASDPATDQAELAQLANLYPGLRAAIAHNPAAYPGLLDWLRELGDPGVDAALASRPAVLAARARVADPTTPATELAELALRHPSLGDAIAAHPAAYDSLRAWIAEHRAEPATAPVEVVEVPAPWTPRRLALVAGGVVLIAGGTVAVVAAVGSLIGGG